MRYTGDLRSSGTSIKKSDGYGHDDYGHSGYGHHGGYGGGCSLKLPSLCELLGIAAVIAAGAAAVAAVIAVVMGKRRRRSFPEENLFNTTNTILQGRTFLSSSHILVHLSNYRIEVISQGIMMNKMYNIGICCNNCYG